ncbi:hypothetical protein [Micromonospora sp. NPDC049301]|uniref:hypothetical protein n=1 Tax=Micromonospora sp. NPDC049301 TaxID=3155723 RepID=UPI0034242E7E
MSRFVQPVPPPADPYAGHALLRSWLERHLGPAGHAAWGDEQAELAARLWARRGLRHEEIAEDAHHHLDLLC